VNEIRQGRLCHQPVAAQGRIVTNAVPDATQIHDSPLFLPTAARIQRPRFAPSYPSNGDGLLFGRV
jgi:hypothetical protein